MDIFDRLIDREGGAKVVNIDGDGGGLTKFGISQRSYPQLDIANLTRDEARAIYFRDYYKANNIQLLPDGLREAVLDWVVHSGPRPAIFTLQRLLGVETDGQIGSVTALAAAGKPVGELVHSLCRERLLFIAKQIVENPVKIKFLKGWIGRVMGLLYVQ